ncbi:MAG TPA: hypothetical protein VGD80_04405 [Kofleriaceae bacterium]
MPGRITDVAIDPASPQNVFATTVGGVYYSANGGRRWARISDALFAGKAASVAVVGAGKALIGFGDPNYHFTPSCTRAAGTSCVGGIYLFDAQGNFTHAGATPDPAALDDALIYRLVAATAVNPTTVYAATSKGVYQGTLNGGTWIFALHGLAGKVIEDLEIDRSGAAPILYAGERFAASIWKYDGTAASPSWVEKTDGIPSPRDFTEIELALSVSNPRVLYARFWGKPKDIELGAIYRTTSAAEPPVTGTAWTLQSSPTGCTSDWYKKVLAVDPASSQHVFCGSTELFESTDSATTWTNMSASPDPAFPLGIHADQHALVFMPGDPNTVIAATDGGLFKSTPRNAATWHWTALSHGMRNTESHTVSGQLATATVVSSGLQDNGTWASFGNRAWYTIGGADGMYSQVDATNADQIYSSWQGLTVYENLQPVPGLAISTVIIDQNTKNQASFLWTTADNQIPTRPVVSDPALGGVAIAVGRPALPAPDDANHRIADDTAAQTLLKTTDGGVSWTTIFTPGANSFIGLGKYWGDHRVAISHNPDAGSGKRSYYVAVQVDPTGTRADSIWLNTTEGNGPWQQTAGFPSNQEVRGIDAVDASNAIAVSSLLFVDVVARIYHWDGTTWTQLLPSSAATSLPGTPTTAVIIDPQHPDTVYAGTLAGVYAGTISGATLDWAPIDFGLPNGVDVQDLWLNTATRKLMVGTYGYGVYLYDIDNPGTCPVQEQLLVRDNVFDTGSVPSPSGLPDPEHPKTGATVGSVTFFQPDDTPGNAVYWWDSTDTRIDIPAQRSPANQLPPPVDNVEFEACPIEAQSCATGTMVDTQPTRGADANAYIQVQQRGLGSVSNVRVMTLFTDASTEVPPLPPDFWTATFPARDAAGNGTCGALGATTNGWQIVGCTASLGPVAPGVPEVAWFPWHVPENAAEHSCMVTIIDSGQDPISADLRSRFRVEELTPASPLIAQRNLHVVSPPAAAPAPPAGGAPGGATASYTGLTDIWVPNFSAQPAIKDTLLSASPVGFSGLSFLLPVGLQVPGLPPRCGQPASTPASGAVSISVPRGVVDGNVALGATRRLVVLSSSRVLEDGGGFATITNAGTVETRVGLASEVGSIVSEANTILDGRARVHGSVTLSAPAQLFRGIQATVDGTVTTGATLTPDAQSTWTVPAFVGGRDVTVLNGTTTLAPGSYGRVTVTAGATLRLSTGVYQMDELEQFGRDSTTLLDTAAGPIVVYLRRELEMRGSVLDPSHSGSGALFVVVGNEAKVTGTFQGSIVAPFALQLDLGFDAGATLTGSYFANNIVVWPGTTIVHRSFSGRGNLGSCAPLTAEEQAKAAALGLDPGAVFPVASGGRHLLIPVAASSRVRLGLRYESGAGRPGSAGRFRVLSMSGSTVKGGSTFVVRH